MPKLYIGEYADIGSTTRGSVAIPLDPPSAEHAVEIGAVSTQSDVLRATTCIVKLRADVDCAVAVGTDPDATGSLRLLNAREVQWMAVPAGSKFKIAVIATASNAVPALDTLDALLRVIASPDSATAQLAALTDHAAKLQAAANDLRGMDAEHKATLAAIQGATDAATAAKADADRAAADVADREAKLQQATADLAARTEAIDKASVGLAAATDQAAGLLAERSIALDKNEAAQKQTAADIDARGRDLSARESALQTAQADYDARLAKLKALAG